MYTAHLYKYERTEIIPDSQLMFSYFVAKWGLPKSERLKAMCIGTEGIAPFRSQIHGDASLSAQLWEVQGSGPLYADK